MKRTAFHNLFPTQEQNVQVISPGQAGCSLVSARRQSLQCRRFQSLWCCLSGQTQTRPWPSKVSAVKPRKEAAEKQSI